VAARREGQRRTALNRAVRRAHALGWFGLGLGLAHVVAPGAFARMVGLADDERKRRVLWTIGLRQIVIGVGVLTRPRRAGGVWTRTVGDLIDLALLAGALSTRRRRRARLAAAAATVLALAVIDGLTAGQLSRPARPRRRGGIFVSKSITVNRPLEEVYLFWRNFENLPRFMAQLESVKVLGGRSRWRAKGPPEVALEWDVEIIDDRPNVLLAWHSLDDDQVTSEGCVQFECAPGGRGTEVRVELEYFPRGRRLGSSVARVFGRHPGQQIQRDLRRFKQVIETGEIVHSDASIYRGRHPARPPGCGQELVT
jgi:uncharacterized membrane protein